MPLRALARRRLRPGTVAMDTQRLILLFIFGFSLLMLWEAWEKERRPKPPAVAATNQAVPTPAKPAAPGTPGAAAPAVAPGSPPSEPAAEKGEIIRVRTDLVVADIDTVGATLKRIELLKHKDAKDATKNLVLLGPEHRYEAQSGLTGEAGPNHRTLWQAKGGGYSLAPGHDAVEIRLSAENR